MNLTCCCKWSSLTSWVSSSRYDSPSCRLMSGWVCPTIRYCRSGCFLMMAGRAEITYSMPLPRLSSPKVESTVVFVSLSFDLDFLVSLKGVSCTPWGMTVILCCD